MHTDQRVHHVIADELSALGVRAAFGLMGEDTAALITDLERVGIAYYGAHHDGIAVAMADGYSWATGTLGVAIVSRGPGLANSLGTAVAAVRGRRSVLILTGDTPTVAGPGPDLKRFDAAALAHTAGLGHVAMRSPGEASSALREAARLSQDGRPQLLTVPIDVLHAPAVAGAGASAEPEARRPAAAPTAEQVAQIAELVERSQRPLILAGRGAAGADAREALEQLAERAGALLGTTLVAKDLFRGHRLDVGVVGGFSSPAARELLAQVDCVLAFGASISSYTTAMGALFGDVPVVQVDTDASAVGATRDVQLGVVADARATAEALKAAIPQRPQPGAALDPALDAFDDAGSETEVDPRSLAVAFGELLPEDVTVILDGGHFMTFPGMHVRVSGPDRFRHTSDFASVGHGLGNALGVAVGRPDSTTVLFIGDGGLRMTLGDLETVGRYGLPLVVAVMNDHAYGAERHLLDLAGLPHGQSLFPDTDFAAVATALGIEAETVRSLEDLRALGSRLSATRTSPLVLDCKVQPEVRAKWLEELAY